MNIRNLALTAATAAILPIVGHAQESTEPVTRAQVQAELVQLEQCGYRPSPNDRHYPADIQAAEARIHTNANVGANDSHGVGGVSDGSSASRSISVERGTSD